MSFPNILYGDYGDEITTYATKPESIEMGRLMILPDGKKFRFCKASATVMVAGDLYQQNSMAVVAGTADADILNNLAVASGGVAGSSTVVVTMAATAHFSKDLLTGGTLFVVSGTAAGHAYKIKNNTVAGSLAACTLTIDGEFKTSFAAGSTVVGVRQNPYDNITLTTADTVGVGDLAGVVPVAIPASTFGWIQRSGVCPVLTDNTTLVIGNAVIASTTVAGAIGSYSPDITAVAVTDAQAAGTAGFTASAAYSLPSKSSRPIGMCLNVAGSGKYSLIDLMLE